MANSSQEYVSGVVGLMGDKAPISYQFLHKHAKSLRVTKNSLTGTMPMGRCYENSFLCLQPGMSYCEGLAVARSTLPIPMEHAWVLGADGRAFDPTWEDGYDYFGVVFDEVFLHKTLLRTGYHSILGNLHRLRMSPVEVLSYLETGVSNA